MDRLDRFELLEVIGRGGMGVVYRARDPQSGEPVAIKVLLGGGGANPIVRKRFAREAEALARVRHPHVVRALAFDTTPRGEPYLVMEWVAGESLQDRLDRVGALAPTEAAALGATLCDALAACHAAGILHRDLKPANVLVDRDGVLKLTDFGLVRDTDPATSRTALTAAGNMLGSPGFWAPEQALGRLEQVGPATDVFGVGALTYALLTGSPPHHGESLVEVLQQATEPAPPASSRNPRVPAWLDRVLARALAVDPAERYPDVEALGAALQAGFAPAGPRAASPRTASPRTAWIAALSLCLLGGLGAWGVVRAARPGAGLPAASHSPGELPAETPQVAASAPAASPAEPAYLSRPPAEAVVARWHALGGEAEALLAQGRYREAAARCTQAIELWPEHPDAWVIRGRVRRVLDDPAGAIEDYTEAVRLAPEHVGALAQRAFARGTLLDWQGAVEDFERALAIGTDDEEQRRGIETKLEISREKVAQALREGISPRRPAAEVRQRVAQAHYRQGVSSARTGDAAGAVELFTGAIALFPGDPQVYLDRGSERSRLGFFQAGIGDFTQALRLQPDLQLAHFNRGLAHASLNHFDEALADLSASIRLRPDDARGYRYRGVARTNLDDLAGAAADYERALTLAPDAPWAADVRDALRAVRARLGSAPPASPAPGDPFDPRDPIARARWHGEQGDEAAVLAVLDPLIAQGQGTALAYFYRGTARYRLGHLREALADLDEVVRLDPLKAGAYVVRGEAQAKLGEELAALADFDRALELEPDLLEALYDRAFLRGGREDFAGAFQDLNHLLELDPDHAVGFADRGTFRARVGDLPGALEDWRRALELEPDATWAASTRENLRVAEELLAEQGR